MWVARGIFLVVFFFFLICIYLERREIQISHMLVYSLNAHNLEARPG